MTVLVMKANMENMFQKKVLKSGLEFGEPLREPAAANSRIAYSHWVSPAEIAEAVQLNSQVQVLDSLPTDWVWPTQSASVPPKGGKVTA